MVTIPLAVLLPFTLALCYGLLVAYGLIRATDPKRAFLWAIVAGLVGGAAGPGLLAAAILNSDWFAADLAREAWYTAWVNASTFGVVPFLSAASCTAAVRAFAYRRARQVRQG